MVIGFRIFKRFDESSNNYFLNWEKVFRNVRFTSTDEALPTEISAPSTAHACNATCSTNVVTNYNGSRAAAPFKRENGQNPGLYGSHSSFDVWEVFVQTIPPKIFVSSRRRREKNVFCAENNKCFYTNLELEVGFF